MIWSFTKIALFIAAVAALTLGATELAQTGGGIRISLANMEFTFGPVQTVIGLLLLTLTLWLVLKLAGFLVATLR